MDDFFELLNECDVYIDYTEHEIKRLESYLFEHDDKDRFIIIGIIIKEQVKQLYDIYFDATHIKLCDEHPEYKEEKLKYYRDHWIKKIYVIRSLFELQRSLNMVLREQDINVIDKYMNLCKRPEWREEYDFYSCEIKKENIINLPCELDTPRAKIAFERAIKNGYMEVITQIGYKWNFGGDKGQARLGYFCNKAFDQPRPINKLEELFGVHKLSSSITNADIEAKRSDVKKWRKEIEDNIFTD